MLESDRVEVVGLHLPHLAPALLAPLVAGAGVAQQTVPHRVRLLAGEDDLWGGYVRGLTFMLTMLLLWAVIAE